MGTFEIISLVLNLLLGSGLIVTLVTLKSTIKKAEAEAKASEIGNVDSVAKMWRELAEKMETQYMNVNEQVDKLSREVNRLRAINSKIVRLLDRITPENLVDMVEKIKQEINSSEENNHPFSDSPIGRLQNSANAGHSGTNKNS
ncbi:hypothetical protein SAMN05216357_112126 [Porphyromonadaceae bacterium KH3CP3RA]|nr:hypothetical protein SAMN05216357_112126 [Porphyromonadaceae bacterium KH3CP3RA]